MARRTRTARPRRRRLVLAVVFAVVLAGAAAVVVVRKVTAEPETRLSTAMALAPADAIRFSWTDWAGVRRRLDADVSADSPSGAVDRFLQRAYDADLSPMSALISSSPVLQEEYGVSPASLDYELYAQGEEGAVLVLGLADDTDLAELRASFERLGYTSPSGADGVWTGGPDLLAEIGSLTPELGYLRIDEADRVLYASDQEVSLSKLSTRGEADTSAEDAADGSAGGIDEVVAALGDTTAASVASGDYACGALAMSQADDADQAEASDLIDAAGGVDPYDAFAMGWVGDDIRVAFAYEDEERARADADARAALAAGPAPGQGGTFGDRFTLGDVVADGRRLTMEMTPKKRTFVLSDLATGPVLYASC